MIRAPIQVCRITNLSIVCSSNTLTARLLTTNVQNWRVVFVKGCCYTAECGVSVGYRCRRMERSRADGLDTDVEEVLAASRET